MGEDIGDKLFNYVDKVIKKGRRKQAEKAVAKANPELARKVKEYMDGEEERQKWLDKTFGKKNEEEIEEGFQAFMNSGKKKK